MVYSITQGTRKYLCRHMLRSLNMKHEYINDFKPRSKVLLKDVLEKNSRNDTTRVVDNDTDFMTTRVVNIDNETDNITDFSNQKVIIPRHNRMVRRPLDATKPISLYLIQKIKIQAFIKKL